MTAQAARPALLRRRIVSDGFWVLIGQGLAALGTLVGIRILTQVVTPGIFGAVALLMGVAAFVVGLFCTPLIQAALRFYPELHVSNSVHQLRRIIGAKLRRNMTLAVLLLALAGGLYTAGGGGSWLVVLLLAALVIVDAARTLETSLLNAARRHKPFALWAVAEAWARPLAAVALVVLVGLTTGSVLAGYALASSVLLIVVYVGLQREGIHRTDDAGEPRRDLTHAIGRYALPLAPLAIVGWLSGLSDRYIIGGVLGLSDAGIYAAAYGLVSRPFLMIGQVVELTLRPVYQDAVSRKDHVRADRIISIWLMLLAPTVSLGFVAILMWHEQIALLLLGEKFRSGAKLMPWIAAGYAMLVVSYVYERICYAYGATRKVLYVQIVGTTACLILTTAAVLNLGLIGAAMAVPSFYSIQLIAAMISGVSARNVREASN